FKQATGTTGVEYLQRVKIEAAKRSFESSRKHISEVMFDVGYSDSKAFRIVFKKLTGLTPIEYRNKYNKDALADPGSSGSNHSQPIHKRKGTKNQYGDRGCRFPGPGFLGATKSFPYLAPLELSSPIRPMAFRWSSPKT